MHTGLESSRIFPVLVLLVVFGQSEALAKDVVIPPLIEPRIAALSLESLTDRPVINRRTARDLGRIAIEESRPVQEPGMLRDGFVHELSVPIRVRDASDPTPVAFGSMSVARIEVEGAPAARLRFAEVSAGTVLWLAGSEDEEFTRFEPSALAQWGPTTRGSEVFIATDASGAGVVDGVASITTTAFIATEASAVTANGTSCLEDVACSLAAASFDELSDAMRAVVYLRIVRDGQTFVCSGALLSDASQSRTPYLLTARHCVPNAAAAASVEIIWDLRTSACGSNQMAKYQRSYGAELLVASDKTDVALLRLKTPPPAGRVFLGVDTRELKAGDVVHRVSHAYGLAQTYASSTVIEGGMSCGAAPRPHFVYSEPLAGGIANGSSGAPMLVDGLYVAGQLLGLCGADPTNPCATFNDVVDGSIRQSWPLLAEHLAPGLPTAAARRRGARH